MRLKIDRVTEESNGRVAEGCAESAGMGAAKIDGRIGTGRILHRPAVRWRAGTEKLGWSQRDLFRRPVVSTIPLTRQRTTLSQNKHRVGPIVVQFQGVVDFVPEIVDIA